MKLSDIVIVIPSLEPDERLPLYAEKLTESGFEHFVIVDDGSSEKAAPIFAKLDSMPGVKVLHHDVNHGKGVALKTAYRWIMENLTGIKGVLTADADGQHAVADCIHLAELMQEGSRKLLLGARDFSLPDIPPRSRSGNRITSQVFKLLYGQYLQDTQTGLRAFLSSDLEFMANVEGERYEYEMKVLIACARARIPMESITIETIYENNNEVSHFHPVRDSIRIYKVILGSFFKFMCASLASWVIDFGLFNLLYYVVFGMLIGPVLIGTFNLAVAVSKTVARVIAATVNYLINRKVVFDDKGSAKKTFARYALLSVAVLIASVIGTTLLSMVLPAWLAAIVVDVTLYFVNFNVQNRWVFRGEDK